MFTMLQKLPPKRIALEQLPTFAVSLIIAEFFYKFHSFSMECIAFLFTWFVIDALLQRFLKK